MADLNNLNAFDLVPVKPAIQPSYYPAAPIPAQSFNQFGLSAASQLGATTLDVYSAPGIPVAPGNGLGHSRAIPGNGIVLAGNAPYQGIYTGIQQE